MPAAKPPVLIEAELENVLARFRAYCERARASPKDGRHNLSPQTAASYSHHVKRFLRRVGRLHANHVDAHDYAEWMLYEMKAQKTGEPPRPTTLRMAFFALRTWFEFRDDPMQDGALPMPSQSRAERVVFLTVDECRSLLEKIEHLRDHALVTTLLHSGLRASECAALRVGDFDPEAGLIHVPARGTNGRAAAKGSKTREVAIGERCIVTLGAYLKSRGAPGHDEPLFPSERNSEFLSGRAISDVVRHWSERALTRRVSAHVLRHTLAVHLADDTNGKAPMPLRRIQEQLGHSNVATTLRYVHAAKGGLIESYKRSAPSF